ncbi:hypothetical protein P9D47_05085 [Bacillus haynesii]|uniref:hypothetical protein n=1 Tax=Bacillus haynesii TaxID=1925021 RepID=UPI001C3D1668|nr:hypothetical protein [Bacillus haynesii]MCY7781068.1 hypothetical protein [Bacillus haynesii]MEC0668894.1 hypothetical protein [Bacillus haynesii]MEC1417361.1 hypothetical protein [Bacillus haynesii]MEC1467432.1 hypothetical protein [Bacillus haynesii]
MGRKPEDMLNEVVKPKEIMEYFDYKYDSYMIVSQKTIKRWIDELGIECIQPKPQRNKDIRYKKSDVLKLEEEKQYNLLKKAEKQIRDREIKKIAHASRRKIQEYYDMLSSVTDEERRENEFQQSLSDYSVPAENTIKQDMVEMCFKELFPNVEFNKEELKKCLFITDNQDMFNDLEYGKAKLYLEEKLYIKTQEMN